MLVPSYLGGDRGFLSYLTNMNQMDCGNMELPQPPKYFKRTLIHVHYANNYYQLMTKNLSNKNHLGLYTYNYEHIL